jgi:hypothetical protein
VSHTNQDPPSQFEYEEDLKAAARLTAIRALHFAMCKYNGWNTAGSDGARDVAAKFVDIILGLRRPGIVLLAEGSPQDAWSLARAVCAVDPNYQPQDQDYYAACDVIKRLVAQSHSGVISDQ